MPAAGAFRRPHGAAVLALLFSLALSAPARAGIVDKDELLPEWFKLDAEYRVETLYINPLGLSDPLVRDVNWTEQRFRTDLGFLWPKVGGIFVQVDMLDGVLFGDNGDFGSEPAPSSGLAVTSRWPNHAGWEVGLASGADPLAPESYVPVLKSIEPIQLRRVYADVYLPIGLLRVGRQPFAYGAGIAGHEGGRTNRWGVSRYSPTADRVLLGTKLDQLVELLINGSDAELDSRIDRGVILALAFDWGTQDEIQYAEDDLYQMNVLLQWLVPEADWFGWEWRDFAVSTGIVHRWNDEFGTAVWAMPFRVKGTAGPVSFDLQYSLAVGKTREPSEGFAELAGTNPREQQILGMGAQARFDVQVGFAELTLEFDYAAGDPDPRSQTDITSYSFVRDFNVGLLMFEHVLAFESARSAAVGIENLIQLGADSFPLTEVATQGRFNNAFALFPQAKLTIVDTPEHRAHARFGVLMAWPSTKYGVVDPVMTTLREDGHRIDDDAVNFHGGDPGSYYGTEIDVQLQWTYRDFFIWTIESAVLFPGSSLRDIDGDAQTSFLFENRFTFAF